MPIFWAVSVCLKLFFLLWGKLTFWSTKYKEEENFYERNQNFMVFIISLEFTMSCVKSFRCEKLTFGDDLNGRRDKALRVVSDWGPDCQSVGRLGISWTQLTFFEMREVERDCWTATTDGASQPCASVLVLCFDYQWGVGDDERLHSMGPAG